VPEVSVARGRATTEVSRSVEVARVVTSAPERGVIFRRSGAIAGDAARNSGGEAVTLAGSLASGRSIRIDWESRTVRVSGGVPIGVLLAELLRHGWCPASTPDDLGLTVSGAVACCAFGNDHPATGAFADQVLSFDLIDGDGNRRTCEPEGPTADHFWASVGGLGLTGVITRATLRIVPVSSAWLSTESAKCPDLEQVLSSMTEASSTPAGHVPGRPRYLWARLDPTVGGAQLGRGVVTTGEHTPVAALPTARQASALDFDPDLAPSPAGSADHLTGGRWRRLIRRGTVRAAHDLWFRSTPTRTDGLLSLADSLTTTGGLAPTATHDGRSEVIEHELVMPDDAHRVIAFALETCLTEGVPVSRAILRRLGIGNRGPLALPDKGWALRLRLTTTFDTGRVLDAIDEAAVDAGGRVSLALDRRMNPGLLPAMYPEIDRWRRTRRELDPAGHLCSDLARRLSL